MNQLSVKCYGGPCNGHMVALHLGTWVAIVKGHRYEVKVSMSDKKPYLSYSPV